MLSLIISYLIAVTFIIAMVCMGLGKAIANDPMQMFKFMRDSKIYFIFNTIILTVTMWLVWIIVHSLLV